MMAAMFMTGQIYGLISNNDDCDHCDHYDDDGDDDWDDDDDDVDDDNDDGDGDVDDDRQMCGLISSNDNGGDDD